MNRRFVVAVWVIWAFAVIIAYWLNNSGYYSEKLGAFGRFLMGG